MSGQSLLFSRLSNPNSLHSRKAPAWIIFTVLLWTYPDRFMCLCWGPLSCSQCSAMSEFQPQSQFRVPKQCSVHQLRWWITSPRYSSTTSGSQFSSYKISLIILFHVIVMFWNVNPLSYIKVWDSTCKLQNTFVVVTAPQKSKTKNSDHVNGTDHDNIMKIYVITTQDSHR